MSEKEFHELSNNDIDQVTGGARARQHLITTCPRCNSTNTYRAASEGAYQYTCNDCGAIFDPVARRF